jgi:hypothetical protein
VWYVAPVEMNEGTYWGQGYNQPTKGFSAEERPNKRPLTLTFISIDSAFHPLVFIRLTVIFNNFKANVRLGENEKERQCKYKVTMRRVRVTVVQ